jgi:hypothetical protein
MTTVDNHLPTGWVERAESRAAQSTVDVRRILLVILGLIPVLIGWTVGTLVRGAVLAFAMAQEGYAIGRGAEPAAPGGRRE